MQVIHYSLGQEMSLPPMALAIGYFDGLHRGHQALFMKIKEYASNNQIKSAVMTFAPNPLVTLGKMKEERYLTSYQDRADILEEMGIDYLIIVEFTKEVSCLSPEDFYDRILNCFDLRYIVCGFDFHFGYQGKGNGEILTKLAECPVYIQDEVTDRNLKISTTRISDHLAGGYIEEVNLLLGRPYFISGKIIKGRQIGRTIGFPTANVDYGHYVIPKFGVYVTKIKVKGKTHLGMCNIGFNPTFTSLDKPSLEVNILDFDEDIYDEHATVYFYHMIRPEQKFDSAEGLIEQLKKDQQTVADFFK